MYFKYLVMTLATISFTGCLVNDTSVTPEFSEKEIENTKKELTQKANCYTVEEENSPVENEDDISHLSSTWCYYTDTSSQETYIFNGDESNLDGGLFAIIRHNENGDHEVIHGSMSNGEMTYHRANPESPNPLPIPINESEIATRYPHSLIEFTREISKNFLELDYKAKNYVEPPPERYNYEDSLYYITAGESEVHLEKEKQPWNGWFWPFGSLTANSNSPLHIFDRFVEKYLGKKGKASEWEDHNRPGNVVGGHCNGWSAASILYPEPEEKVYSPELGQDIDRKTSKALLTVSSFCVHWAFYGKRFYLSSPKDEEEDIAPELFHKVLLYYIKKLGKPVAMDYYPGYWVDNTVISGYKFKIKRLEDHEYKYRVDADLTTHYYTENDKKGVAPIKIRSYSYYLDVDDNGIITKGKWISKNPDFMWVPLAARNCGRQNPHVTKELVEKIVYRTPTIQDPGQDPG
ncbi:MAG: hypothetical protein KDD50_16300, partial [Bdellovibrionales bacterium]|nr:hypothetical protein [Bdellovibrionales bacterium]